MNGKGGVVWMEVTSLVNNPNPSTLAPQFLEYVQHPEVAKRVAFAEGTYNPVAQMGNKKCFDLFSKDELDAIQWDTLEEEMPEAYKDVERVVNVMHAAGISRKVARLRPIGVVKG